MEPDIITISFAEYEELLDDQYMLHKLMDNGVDNWEGFLEAEEEYFLGIDTHLDVKLSKFIQEAA